MEDEGLLCNGRQVDGGVCTCLETEMFNYTAVLCGLETGCFVQFPTSEMTESCFSFLWNLVKHYF